MLLFSDFIDRFGQVQPDGQIAFDVTIQSLVVSMMSIGTLFGALAGAYTADWVGRSQTCFTELQEIRRMQPLWKLSV